ncbi:MAG TPA: hypothetical protein VK449_00020, partial [Anaerolineales bacterium]|nr:hypothetical protein [Anaerolineales bacterium]
EVHSASIRNLPPNLYNYLGNPVRLLRVFPYLKPHWGGTGMSVLHVHAPPGYYSRQVAGLLLVAPFSLYALAAAAGLWRRRAGGASDAESEQTEAVRWLTGILLAIAAVDFAVVQVFVVASMRYEADFVPTLMLAAAFGLWGTIADRRRRGQAIFAAACLGLFLMAWTALAGLLLGVTSYHARFEKLNPRLFKWLTDVFTP